MVLDLNALQKGELLEIKWHGQTIKLAGSQFSLNQSMPSPIEMSFHGYTMTRPGFGIPELSIDLKGSVVESQIDPEYKDFVCDPISGEFTHRLNKKSTFEKIVDPDLSGTNISTSSYFASDWDTGDYNEYDDDYESQAENEVNQILGNI